MSSETCNRPEVRTEERGDRSECAVVWCVLHADSFPVGRLLSQLSVCDNMSFVEADCDAGGLGGAELSWLGHCG